MNLHNVIIAPFITEKTESVKTSKDGSTRYSFKVHPDANKELISQALQGIYKVNVIKVNTSVVPGKKKRFRNATAKLPTWKKAVVTLAPGQTIDLVKNS